ncbi:MAG: NfeD family protein [Oligoflexus sp.]
MAMTWLIIGGCLIIAEIFLPGGIAFFFGSSALLVASMIFLGAIQTWTGSFVAWISFSVILFLLLNKTIRRWLKPERSYQYQEEDAESYEKIVDLIEAIPVGGEGRIAFQGTTWTARNHKQDQAIAAGSKVRLLYREGLVWVVERS